MKRSTGFLDKLILITYLTLKPLTISHYRHKRYYLSTRLIFYKIAKNFLTVDFFTKLKKNQNN